MPASIYFDAVPNFAKLVRSATEDGPDSGLAAVAAIRRVVEHLEADQVGMARASGWSWQDIAELLGVSRQAVHKKYAHRLR